MSLDENEANDVPYPMITNIFSDATKESQIKIDDLKDFISYVAFQAVADGRVTVFLNKQVVYCSLTDISNEFLRNLPDCLQNIIMIKENETVLVDQNEVSIPKSVPYVTFQIIGPINALIRFEYISGNRLPKNYVYPIACVGFEGPLEDQALVDDFEQFLESSPFSIKKYTPISKKRCKLERRNRDFLLQTSKTRANLIQRFNETSSSLQKKQKQLELLNEKISTATNTNRMKSPNFENISDTIEQIDTSINALVETTDKLSLELDQKAKGIQMTRSEELELLQTLKQQLSDSKSQLEVLKQQASH